MHVTIRRKVLTRSQGRFLDYTGSVGTCETSTDSASITSKFAGEEDLSVTSVRFYGDVRLSDLSELRSAIGKCREY